MFNKLTSGTILCALCALGICGCQSKKSDTSTQVPELPINVEAASQYRQMNPLDHDVEWGETNNSFSLEQLSNTVSDGQEGLEIDFSKIKTMLDGAAFDPEKISGTLFIGPYPFDAASKGFAHKRFISQTKIINGKALAKIDCVMEPKYNVNKLKERGIICLRFMLYLDHKNIGTYDIFAAFCKRKSGYLKIPCITEGPMINLLNSDNPREAVISFSTDISMRASVVLSTGEVFNDLAPTKKHEIKIKNITPSKNYRYLIDLGMVKTDEIPFQAAPVKGEDKIKFAVTGDCRGTYGGGLKNYLTLNYQTMQQLAATAYSNQCDFLLMGGDLQKGYTMVKDDLNTGLGGFKQAVNGYWRSRPVYPTPGNHETLINVYKLDNGKYLELDKWPYNKQSSEAAFSEAFTLPQNAPALADTSRPSYLETVYSFHYGSVKIICLNNVYWYSTCPEEFGGSPVGYLMADQMKWLERELTEAENSAKIKHVFVMLHAPCFPNGGHVNQGMWYNGNNHIRAWTYSENKLKPSVKGIIELRNQLVKLIANSNKTVAVLTSHEHNYSRTLINNQVPVGSMDDDKNGNGIIDWKRTEPATPLKDLKNPVWYFVAGAGGAPYRDESVSPWNRYWKSQKDTSKYYFFSPKESLLIFETDGDKVSLKVLSPFGEIIDSVEDLRAVKKTVKTPPAAKK